MRIRSTLERRYKEKIDLKDYDRKPEKEKEKAFLTRSLSAFALSQLAGISDSLAATCVIDGYDDNGIDAIYYDANDNKVYIVQSKWMDSGRDSPKQGDIQKFLKGFKDFLNADFSQFNDKLKNMKDVLSEALYNAQVRFVLVITYTGSQPLSEKHAKRDLENLLKELNDPIELVTYQVLSQRELYNAAEGLAEGSPINLDILIRDWGQIDHPYLAYYGQLDALDIANWWQSYSDRLFAPNLRKFLGNTEVNESIIGTLINNPEKFWYFNNGVTILCETINQKPIGKGSTKSGVFECTGVSIVNGAQTVGSIAKAFTTNPEKVCLARVSARLISLDNCPEGFATEITRAANTQNKIEHRDFVSLDLEQKRLQTDLRILCDKEYVYKSGDQKPKEEIGCDLEEATVALACANANVELAVQAKREIGKLWEDTEKPPYKLLFNSQLSAIRLWRLVEVSRIVENELRRLQNELESRKRLVAIHGNRFILYRIFRSLSIENFDNMELEFEPIKIFASEKTKDVLSNLIEIINFNPKYSNSYPANLFKNKTKCLEISCELDEMEGRKDKESSKTSDQIYNIKNDTQLHEKKRIKTANRKEKVVLEKEE
jgi:hypothetical protein